MNITIIGAGNVGKALTGRPSGQDTPSSSARPSGELGPGVGSGDRRAARPSPTAPRSRMPSVVVLAVPYTAVPEILDEIGPALDGKILIDATNPLKADYSGLATNGTSGAEEIQAKVPGARVVKAFNTALAAQQADPKVAGGLRADGYVAGDDEEAKATVLGLVEAIGFNPVDAGGLAMAGYLEGMAWLNISLQMKNGWSWQASWKLVGPNGDAA